MNATGTKSRRRAPPPGISARLGNRGRLETHSNGAMFASFDGYSVGLGTFGAAAAARAQELHTGLPLSSLASDKEIDLLVRRLAGHGLLEYRIGQPQNAADDLFVIEPQVARYWPRVPPLDDADVLVLSRFAYMRRRGNAMALESPRAGALFRIYDPKLAGLVAMLSAPQKVRQLRREDGFPGLEFLALLVGSDIVLKSDIAGGGDVSPAESDHDLVLWEFHDFLFHTRSTEGRHANPLGGVYPHSGTISPLPPLRPSWPGKTIDLCEFLAPSQDTVPPLVKLLRDRHSTRDFDDRRPITLAELSRFLDGSARVLAQLSGSAGLGDNDAAETVRPYPSAGASYELELYLTVNNCEGLAKGFYHYDPGTHALVQIEVPANELKALSARAADAMDVPGAPQVLITIAARFGRVSLKYGSIAYSLILKDVGVLTQTFYLTATEMGLGGCAIGIVNIDQFARMTGLAFEAEGPVGLFAMGRGATSSG